MNTIAYLTTDEEGSPAMLFFDKAEAATYCGEDEEPQALVLQSDALKAIEETNDKHEKLLKDLRWRMDDIRDMLMKEGFNGQRIYGCDEWSTPTVNLQSAIDLIDRSLKESP